jgi:hypothetical protein
MSYSFSSYSSVYDEGSPYHKIKTIQYGIREPFEITTTTPTSSTATTPTTTTDTSTSSPSTTTITVPSTVSSAITPTATATISATKTVTLPLITSSNPALSPQELQDKGYPDGMYWYKMPDMEESVKLMTKMKSSDNKPWVRVFSSKYETPPTENFIGKNIPFKGFKIQTADELTQGYTYFDTYQFFKERDSKNLSTGGNRPGSRVYIGKAGGHGIYTASQEICNWPYPGTGAIGSGWMPDTECGTFPDKLKWGTGTNSTSSSAYTLSSPNTVWETWLWWDNVSEQDEWKFWNSTKSVNLNTIIPKSSIDPPNGKVPTRSSVRYLNSVDLFPFKVVTLQYLVDIGKVILAGNGYYGEGTSAMIWGDTWYTWGRVHFDPTDKWLPVGDIVYQANYNPNTIPVLLVSNDEKYSVIIDKADWKWIGDRYKCNGGVGMEWNQSYYSPTSSKYKSDYIAIGCTVNVGERSRGDWDNVAFYGRKPCVVAINNKYLTKLSRAYSEPSLSIGGWPGDCWNSGAAVFTSPFFSFSVWGSRSGVLGVEDYYDIVPRNMLSKCCAGTLPNEIDKTKYCGPWTDSDSPYCTQGMNNYCTDKNLLTDDCVKYIKSKNLNFNSQLQSYCSKPDADKTHPNFQTVCSCFFPQSFYDNWRSSSLTSVADPKLASLLLAQYKSPVIPKCEYPFCANSTSLQPFENPSIKCPDNQIQQCINNSYTSYDGSNFEKSNIDATQAINCVQTSETTNIANQPSTTTTSATATPTATTTPAPAPSTTPSTTPTSTTTPVATTAPATTTTPAAATTPVSSTTPVASTTAAATTPAADTNSSFLDRFKPLADIIGTSPIVILIGLIVLLLLIIFVIYYLISKRSSENVTIIQS